MQSGHTELITRQGRATRARIIVAATQLIAERGAAATSLSDVRTRAGVSQSQLYHYFGDKQGLVEAAVDEQARAVVDSQASTLAGVRRWRDLERWAEEIVAGTQARECRGGCPLGTLAAAMADVDEAVRERLAAELERWRQAIRSALERLREEGELNPRADVDVLASATLATLQGGLLLAKTTRESTSLRIALDGALSHIRAHSRERNG